MWCTRWFLPLLLLPIPTAPPYFLLIFLFSLTLHARPCVYCIVLLTTLFVSSCYWQPFPLDTRLAAPWSDSILTFSDALQASLPSTYTKPLPQLMRAMDRCWCDATGSFFDPFDVVQWEEKSVRMLKLELLKEQLEEERQAIAPNIEEQQLLEEMDSKDHIRATAPSATILAEGSWFSRWRAILLKPTFIPTAPSAPTPTSTQVQPVVVEKHSKRKGELDLNPYGFALVVDFGLRR